MSIKINLKLLPNSVGLKQIVQNIVKDFRFQQQREVIFKQDKLTQIEGEDQINLKNANKI